MILSKTIGQVLLSLIILILLPITTNYISENLLNTRSQQLVQITIKDGHSHYSEQTTAAEFTKLQKLDTANYYQYRDRVYRTKMILISITGLAAIVAGIFFSVLPAISLGLILGGTLSLAIQDMYYWLPKFTTIRFSVLLLALLLLLIMSFRLARNKHPETLKQVAIGLAIIILLPTISYIAPRLILTQPDTYNFHLNSQGLSDNAMAQQDELDRQQFDVYKAKLVRLDRIVGISLDIIAITASLFVTQIPFLAISLILGGAACLFSALKIHSFLGYKLLSLNFHPIFNLLILACLMTLTIGLFIRFRVINFRR